MTVVEAIQSTCMFLYHVRDPETSAGFGNDGYTGVTKDFDRRKKEHFRDLAAGTHSNRRLQELYDRSGGNLQMVITTVGPEDEIYLRERASVNRPNKHANQQVGGGPFRGMSDADVLQGFADMAAKAARETSSGDSQNSEGMSDRTKAVIVVVLVVVVVAAAYAGWRFWKNKKARQAAHDEALAAYEANVSLGWTPSLNEINEKLHEKHHITPEEAEAARARGKETYYKNIKGEAAKTVALELYRLALERGEDRPLDRINEGLDREFRVTVYDVARIAYEVTFRKSLEEKLEELRAAQELLRWLRYRRLQ